jgi:hypothetical protein
LTTIRSRKPRRLSLSNRPSTDATRAPGPAGLVASDESVRYQKRVDHLLARAKDAEGAARYWNAVAGTVLRTLWEIAPGVFNQVRGSAFVAGVEALVDGDAQSGAAVADVLGRLAPEAAEAIFQDLVNGPATLVALAQDSARLEAIAALPPTPQSIELGKVIAEVAARHRPRQQHSNSASTNTN